MSQICLGYARDPGMGTGSREENASNQKMRARLRFNQMRTRSNRIHIAERC
jgi:hypothetical protein